VEPVTERLTASPHSSPPTPSGSPFPAIAEYEFRSDCEVSACVVSALIAASGGGVEWMGLPRIWS
jgi:hypothetical protein